MYGVWLSGGTPVTLRVSGEEAGDGRFWRGIPFAPLQWCAMIWPGWYGYRARLDWRSLFPTGGGLVVGLFSLTSWADLVAPAAGVGEGERSVG